jgi:hypothetical protein
MKKMMISTALATSLIAGVASAETQVKAYIEATMGSGETPSTSSQTNQGTTIGFEHGVTFSGSKELDNGMTLGTTIALEDAGAATAKAKGVTFTSGNTSVIIGNDINNIDDKQAVPAIANMIEDGNKGLGVTYNANKETIHEKNAIGVVSKTDYGTFGLNYAPKTSSSGFDDSNPNNSAKTGSGLAIGFNGSLGVDGLGVVVSQTTQHEDGDSNKEQKMTVVGANYNFGNITVGAQNTTYDDTSGTSYAYSNGKSMDALSYGATVAVSDQISLGVQYAELDGDGITKNEEITSLTAGYNLGGATITLQYHDAENVDGTSRNDGEAIELRLKQSF